MNLDNYRSTKAGQGRYSARYHYLIRVPATMHRGLFEHLYAEGIGVNLHYIPVYWKPEYRRLGFEEGQRAQAEQYYREAMSLPMYSALTDEQHRRVAEGVTRMMEKPVRAAR